MSCRFSTLTIDDEPCNVDLKEVVFVGHDDISITFVDSCNGSSYG